jgi:hypothetical protein
MRYEVVRLARNLGLNLRIALDICGPGGGQWLLGAQRTRGGPRRASALWDTGATPVVGDGKSDPAGVLGIIGFVSIDPHDPRALKENRHPISEAGLQFLLDNTARYWEMERRLNQTQVQISAVRFQGRPCVRIETIHPPCNDSRSYAYRCVLCLDQATHLPVRVEAYDYPRPNGPAGGDLLESYRYLDLRCTIGLVDEIFDPDCWQTN